MRIWDWVKRKIWREPTDEEVKTDVEKLLSRLAIMPEDICHIEQLMDAQEMFEPIPLPDGSLPESMKFSRAKDYQEAYKEIFGRTPDEDLAIQEALGLYKDEE